MKVSITNETSKDTESPQKPHAKVVYLVIMELDGWDETIKGIYFDKPSADKLRHKVERRLKRMKRDDFEVFVRPWKVSR